MCLRTVWIELAREKHARGLQDLIGPAQLGNLPAQGFDLLALLAAQHVLAPALVRFDLANIFAQRLRRDAEIPANVRDRAPRLQHEPRGALQQLLGVLPHSWHARRLLPPPDETWHQSLRQTQDGSLSVSGRRWAADLSRRESDSKA